jgi:hypothetical protein
MNELTEKRTPELIGAEIRMYVNAGRAITMLCGIEIGRRLVEAKDMLEHGEWLPWLERETEFSERSAQNYMKVFREYGALQMNLFGPETNTKSFADLPITKALALLSVPESERIEFAEEVDAEHISVRELQQAIKEKEKEKEEAETRAKQAEKATEEIRNEREALSLALKHAKDQVRELESRPVEVAVEKDEAAIAAAAKEAREQAEAEAAKKISGMETKLQKAEQDLEKAKKEAEHSGAAAKENIDAMMKEKEFLQKQLEDAQKQLKTSAADVTAFGIRFNSLQEEFGYMIAELRKVRARDQETGEKLSKAVRELLEYFGKEAEKDV